MKTAAKPADLASMPRADSARPAPRRTAPKLWRATRRALRVLAGSVLALSAMHAFAADGDEARLLDQGRALATAADCMACHTVVDGGKPYAGGYAIQSPLGAIYATNITPSKKGGIGDYTEQDFARALREGIRKDGAHLYPAMPYTSYTLLSDGDVKALYTYFMKGVAPVDTPSEPTNLPFPFSVRTSMAAWNLLFLDNKRFVPDPSKSEQINQGAYLANALAHCSTCHTPRNDLMAEKPSMLLSGSAVGPWFAPNITSDAVSGIGAWSNAELVQYLRTGRVAGKAQAGGPMAEAIEHSLQHLPQADLEAIAAYLKSTPPIRATKVAADAPTAFQHGKPATGEAALRGMDKPNAHDTLFNGERLYNGYCASCHQTTGAGSKDQSYPSLFHNTATGGETSSNLIAAILYGVDRKVGDQHVLMPRFDQLSYVDPLTNEQIASISTYVLNQFGNSKLTVTPADVQTVRNGGDVPLLVKAQPWFIPAGVVGLLLVLAVIALIVRRRRRVK